MLILSTYTNTCLKVYVLKNIINVCTMINERTFQKKKSYDYLKANVSLQNQNAKNKKEQKKYFSYG